MMKLKWSSYSNKTSTPSRTDGKKPIRDQNSAGKAKSDSNVTGKLIGAKAFGSDGKEDRIERGGSTGFFTLPNSVSTMNGATVVPPSPARNTIISSSIGMGGVALMPSSTTNPAGDTTRTSFSPPNEGSKEGVESSFGGLHRGTLDDSNLHGTQGVTAVMDERDASSHTGTSTSAQSYPTTTSSATTLLNNNLSTVPSRRVSFHDHTSSGNSFSHGASGTLGASGGDRFSLPPLLGSQHSSMVESIANENALERMGLIHKSSSIRTTNISGGRNMLRTEEFTINKLQFGTAGQLFGRDNEIEWLRKVYNATVGSNDENEKTSDKKSPRRASFTSAYGPSKHAAFIGGAPGSGKSVLAMDVTKRLCRRSGGFFMSGKFSVGGLYGTTPHVEDAKAKVSATQRQQQQTQPYSGVGDACSNLIADILMIYFQNEEDGMNRSEALCDYSAPLNPLLLGSESSSQNHINPRGDGAPPQPSESVPSNYHRWKFTRSQMKSVWAQERNNLEILSPIVNNIEGLWAEASDGATDVKDEGIKHSAGFAGSKQAIHYAFARFFFILSKMAPVAILLDDLQWADPESLELFESLLVDESLSRLLFIGTIRNDAETNEHNPVTNMEAIVTKFARLQRRSNTTKSLVFGLHRMEIEPLAVPDMTLWLQALLDIPADSVTDLAECVHKRTAGNALYVKEFLLSLNHLGLLKFDFGLMKWQYDIEQILTETVAAQNVVTILTKRIECLPATDQSILPKIASIGSSFTYHMFQVVVEDTLRKERDTECDAAASSMFNLSNDYSHAKAILDNFEVEGILIVDAKHGIIKWAHDKIREAALNLIGGQEGALELVRFEIGKLLFSQPRQNEIDTSNELYVITNLLNSGAEDIAPGSLKNEIIRLNIRSGGTALQSSAFGSASRYFTSGIQLLPPDDQKWEEEFYRMTLDLYAGSAVSHFCVGQHEVVDQVYLQVLHGSRPNTPIIDLRRVYDAHVDSLSARGQTREALEEVVKILKELGCHFPQCGRKVRIIRALIGLMRSVDKRTKLISELPPCEDETIEWIMLLLNRLSTFSYQIEPELLPLIYLKGLKYTLKHGAAEYSGPNLATIGLLLAGVFGNPRGAQKYGDLAVKLTGRNTEAQVMFVANTFIYHFLVPLETCKKPLLKAYEAGLRSGDLESAFWSVYSFLEFQLFTAARLSEFLRDCDTYCWQFKLHQQDKILCFARFTFQLAANLANLGCRRHILTGKIMDETKFEERVKGDPGSIQEWVHYNRNKVYAAFWFGEHERVAEIIEREEYHKFSIEKFNPGVAGTFVMYVHCALSSISLYRKTGAKKHKNRAEIFFGRIKQLVKLGNKNVRHSEALIQAEFTTLTHGKVGRRRLNPMPLYEVAIVQAGRWGLTSDQALAHERVADYALSLGDLNDAKYHYTRALELYADWGAYGKVEHLQDSLKAIPELTPMASIELANTHDHCSSDYSFFSSESS